MSEKQPENVDLLPPRMGPLQEEEAIKMRNSFMRLRELGQSKIITKDSDAEMKMITFYLHKAAYQHLNEFLGCWFVVHREYEPLMNSLGPLVSRCVHGVMSNMAAQQAEPEKKPE